MPSRSSLEWPAVALGAVTQGVWLGVLAAAFTGVAWPLPASCAAVTMVGGAAAARWAAVDEDRLVRGRLLLAAVLLVSVAVLFVAGHGWAHEYVLWRIVRDAVFAAVAVVLGVRLGAGDDGPSEGFARVVRAFGVLCGLLFVAALTHTPLQGQAAAVVTLVLAGGLHVAVLRYRALDDVVAADDRLPLWPWLVALVAAVAAVLVVSGLLASVLDSDAVRSGAGDVFGVLAYAGTVVGYVGGAILRAFAWIAGLVDIRLPRVQQIAPAGRPSLAPRTPEQAVRTAPVVLRFILYAAVMIGTLAAGVLAAALALRWRPRKRRVEAVVEEREAVRSVRSATAEALATVQRRLRGLVPRGRRGPLTPAEVVRRRYGRLERRLARAGRPRAAGTTVREYLATCAPSAQAEEAEELASVYELARYSARALDPVQAERFGELAASFGRARPD